MFNIPKLPIINQYFSEYDIDIIYNLFEIDIYKFDPIYNILDFIKIFEKIKESQINFVYYPLLYYLNFAKVESICALNNKDMYILKYEKEVCEYLNLSCWEMIFTEYKKLENKALVIENGLEAILNFEGFDKENRYFFYEINNFLDLFISEADYINLNNDLVNVAKYIQYMRNNKLRKKFYNNYNNMLKEDGIYSIENNISDEYDLIYNKYKKIEKPIDLNISYSVKNSFLALHPINLDYIKLSELESKTLNKDLELIISLLKEEESYGLRNIHDRIHFLYSYSKFR